MDDKAVREAMDRLQCYGPSVHGHCDNVRTVRDHIAAQADELGVLRLAHADRVREMAVVWRELQRISPWSESNDMSWSDEIMTGVHFLVERAEAAESALAQAGVREPTVRMNDDGSLDEVVGNGEFHLEQMDSNKWWIQLGQHMVTLTARGKISAWFGKNEARIPAGDGEGGGK